MKSRTNCAFTLITKGGTLRTACNKKEEFLKKCLFHLGLERRIYQ
jgi:hypothetical protein